MNNFMDSDVHITYCATAHLDERAVCAAIEQLSLQERARCGQFVFWPDRRDFAIAHSLLRRSLSARGGLAPHEWTFTVTGKGKPALSTDLDGGSHLSFNLAHTNGLVACAVARDADLGIDVEAVDRRADAIELAYRFFSPVEVAGLERCDATVRQTRFIELWTLKEAYVKALGEALSYPLDEFAFIFDDPSTLLFASKNSLPTTTWGFALFAPSYRHRMAIAVGSKSPQQRRLIVSADASHDCQLITSNLALRASNAERCLS